MHPTFIPFENTFVRHMQRAPDRLQPRAHVRGCVCGGGRVSFSRAAEVTGGDSASGSGAVMTLSYVPPAAAAADATAGNYGTRRAARLVARRENGGCKVKTVSRSVLKYQNIPKKNASRQLRRRITKRNTCGARERRESARCSLVLEEARARGQSQGFTEPPLPKKIIKKVKKVKIHVWLKRQGPGERESGSHGHSARYTEPRAKKRKRKRGKSHSHNKRRVKTSFNILDMIPR